MPKHENKIDNLEIAFFLVIKLMLFRIQLLLIVASRRLKIQGLQDYYLANIVA